jgi:hypothetical protein
VTPRLAALLLSVVAACGGAEADAATLVGDAEVTSAAARGARFAVGAGRCGDAVVSEWRDAAGRLVAHEQVDLQGESWVRYRLRRESVGQDVKAVRDGDRVRVQISHGGRERTVSLPAGSSMVAGPLLVPFLQGRLAELRRGEALEFPYLVADQGLSLRLRASRAEHRAAGPAGRSTRTVVRLEAASLLMRPFVPPTVLEFDAAGQFVAMQGRLLPQVGPSSQPQSLDGVMRVHDVPMQSSCHMRNLS